MIVLDTDHATILKYPDNERCKRLQPRLAALSPSEWGTTVITIEEQMRGWMHSIARERKPRRQMSPYRELANLFKFFAAFNVLLFDDKAADHLDTLGSIHIGMMDKKIASIALATGSLLLTANTNDFKHVPGLMIDNWMD